MHSPLNDDDARRLLLERHYGLLDAAEEAALQAYVSEHPQPEVLLAQAQAQAGVIAQAAHLSAPAIDVAALTEHPLARTRPVSDRAPETHAPPGGEADNPPQATTTNTQDSKEPPMSSELTIKPASAPRLVRRPLWAALAAALMVMCGLTLAILDGIERDKLNRNAMVVSLQAPTAYAEGSVVLVNTRDIDGSPRASKLNVIVRDGDSQAVLKTIAVDNPDGETAVALPAEALAASRFVRVDVEASDPGAGNAPVFALQSVNIARVGSLVSRNPTAVANISADEPTNAGQAETIALEPPQSFTLVNTYVASDKPLYRPGDVIFFRALMLNRFNLTPIAENGYAQVTITNGRDEKVFDQQMWIEGGLVSGAHALPSGAAGGEYTIRVSDPSTDLPEAQVRFAPTSRVVIVRQYNNPRFTTDLAFNRDSYVAGERVVAACEIARAEGGAPAGARLTVSVVVDGKPIELPDHLRVLTLGASPFVDVAFDLPETVEIGDGVLSIAIDDGATVETLARTIPIAVAKADVALFPEGGDLIAGVDNRVYFRATDPKGEPLAIEAELIDTASNKVLATFKAESYGMGRFAFAPEAGREYAVRVTKPAGIERRYALPQCNLDGDGKPTGAVLASTSDRYAKGESMTINVASHLRGRHTIVATCRDFVIGIANLDVKSSERQSVSIPVVSPVGGVVRITLHGPDETPIAERLVYREPQHKLNIEVVSDAQHVTPAGEVKLTFRTTDANGKPIPAMLGVSVVDATNLSMADDEDTPTMPLHYLLGMEVEKLEKVELYVDSHKNSAVAIDRLLGTQGWRRFAWVKPADFAELHPEMVGMVVPPEWMQDQLGRDFGATGIVSGDNAGSAKASFDAALQKHNAGLIERIAYMIGILFGLVALALFIRTVMAFTRAGKAAKAIEGKPVASLWLRPAMATAACALLASVVVVFAANPMEIGTEEPATVADAEAPDPLNPISTRVAKLTAADATLMPETATEGAFPGMAFNSAIGLGGNVGGGGNAGGIRNPDRPIDELAENHGAVPPPDVQFAAGDPADVPEFRALNLANRAMREEAEKAMFDRDERGDFDFEDEWNGGWWGPRRVVREYAHSAHEIGEDARRFDFTETIYWHAGLQTDENGVATATFATSHAITSFVVRVEGNTAKGGLGTGVGVVENKLPFFIEPKLPVEVTTGDVIDLPLGIVNASSHALEVAIQAELGAQFRLLGGEAAGKADVFPDAGANARVYFPVEVIGANGEATLTFSGTAGRLKDSVSRTMTVMPYGYPVEASLSGLLQAGDTIELVVTIPDAADMSSLDGEVRMYPSTMATLQSGLEGMLRKPGGCFEQTSSSNYPNVMIMNYLNQFGGGTPDVVRKANDYIADGYGRLTSFECSQRGYEWFGENPGHSALTAYGLLQFKDMEGVYEGVNAEMIERTTGWLMDMRDGEGDFDMSRRALHTWVGKGLSHLNTAYCLWALAESGIDVWAQLDKEMDNVKAKLADSKDPYFLALMANVLMIRDDAMAGDVMRKLATLQAGDGSFMGTDQSITCSTGRNLQIETTALAILALLRDKQYAANVEQAVQWLLTQRSGGGSFGTTQATVLALKALSEHANNARRVEEPGEIFVEVNGVQVQQRVITPDDRGAIDLSDLIGHLTFGENRIRLTTTLAIDMPFALRVNYHTTVPPTDPECAIDLDVGLAKTTVAMGDSVRATATITNKTEEWQAMTVAIIGLPAGLTTRIDQLRELKKHGLVDFYETRGRELILYWREVAPGAAMEIPIDLVAEVPGKFRAPASSAYVYYTDEFQTWVKPLEVEITRD